MSTVQPVARMGGALYLLTFLTSIPALPLERAYLAHPLADPTGARWAAVLDVVLALACLGTAIALHPVIRRTSPALALGFVASRTLEASLILVGAVSVLSVTSVRAQGGGGEAALVAVHDWAFLLGPGVLPAVNAALLGTALLRSRLVPRAIPLLGLVGVPLLSASAVGVVLGAFGQVSLPASVLALPIALWELSLGLWLVARGTRDARVASAPTAAPDAVPVPATMGR